MISTRSRTVPYLITALISAPTALRSSHLGPGTCSGTRLTPAAGLKEQIPSSTAQEKNRPSATRARFTVDGLHPLPRIHRLYSATSSWLTAAVFLILCGKTLNLAAGGRHRPPPAR